MAIDSRKKLKERLISAEIRYTKHFERDVNPERDNISKKLVENHIKDPESLLLFEHQQDQHTREKYDLYFNKSSNYALRIVVSFSQGYKTLYIVTSHVINKKRLEWAQKY